MKERKTDFMEDFQKSSKKKDLEVVLQIKIDNLIQIIVKKDKALQNFLIEINKYKRINMQTLQSQVKDSVENYKIHEETQGQGNHESKGASGPEAPP